MTLTVDDIARLEQAIARGEREVEYESNGERRKVRYRSVDEMMKALSYAKGQVPSGATIPSTLAVFDRD